MGVIVKKLMSYSLGFLTILIFISSCSSDTPYTPPSKAEPTTDEVPTVSEPVKKEPTKTQIFKIGDTTTDNQLKVTLNNVKFVSKIDEKNNQFLVAESPPGKEYVVIDITVENILSSETQAVSTAVETTIADQDGYNYEFDFEGYTALDKQFIDGEILPGMKKRGEVAYLVPTSATDLKFIYKFDLFVGTSAVFDIK